MCADTLSDALARYASKEPHRARGGLGAIAGISFQLQCYVADFISALAHDEDLQISSKHFLEAFSDYIKSDGQHVVCVQVKRTLNKTTLAEVAKEAVLVDEFLESEMPALQHEIAFEPLGFIGNKGGPIPTWVGVQLPKDLAHRDRRQNRFEQMKQAGRFWPPRIDSDPWWRIISACWSKLDDPFAFAREALEVCLKRSMTPEYAREIRDRIAECFVKHRKRSPMSGNVVTGADFVISEKCSNKVLLGQIPTLQHLRDGRFMDRPDHIAAVLTEIDRHVAERDAGGDPYIYGFCIEGRSGSGKSVLLLQLMRQLATFRSDRVIWLDDASEQLFPLLESWAENTPDASGPCYVFVDDFYAPSKRSGVDFQKIARLTRQHERADWPILVTCGPPEQLREWQTSGEGFRTVGWRLPLSNKTEQEQLQSWFRVRTGEEPRTGSAFGDSGGLMMSMMFEMHEGAMLDFGRRFRQRLKHLGLVDAFAPPLALNRLYILAPGNWLDQDGSDALRRLNQDSDFSMLTLTGTSSEFIQVTHPHLSNAIYCAVRELDDGVVRARDLSCAFERSLEMHPPTAGLILRRAAEQHERLSDIDWDELARGMTAAWRKYQSSSKKIAGLDVAAVWTSWAVWNARQPLIAKLLDEQPLQAARRNLDRRHFHWPVFWEQLWNSFPGNEDLLSDGESWLLSADSTESRHWSWVWQKIVEYKKRSHQNPAQLAEVGFARLCSFADSYEATEWAIVWQTLVGLRGSLPKDNAGEMLPLGYKWLSGREDLPEWSYVWRKLVEVRNELSNENARELLLLGYEWLRGRDDRPAWSYVWRSLAGVGADSPKEEARELVRQGYRWLSGREDRPGWNYVWQKLLEMRAGLPEESAEELLSGGFTWLVGREDSPQWKHVWEKLVDVRAELSRKTAQELLQLGYTWLYDREDRSEWAPLLEKLIDVRDELVAESAQELLPRGYRWLRGHEDRPEWSFVWRKLVDLRTELPKQIAQELLSSGYKRLRGREHGDDWTFVWEKLVDVCTLLPNESARELPFMGYEWLFGREDCNGWTHVWEKLLNMRAALSKQEAQKLLAIGFKWLRGREDRNDWTIVWQNLYDCRYRPQEGGSLQKAAWQWLRRPEHTRNSKWNIIWENCFDLGFRNSDFLNAGSTWVLANPNLPYAYGPAHQLLAIGGNAELLCWVRTWLRDNLDHGRWMYGWKPLWDREPSPDTSALLLAWLNHRPHIPAVQWLTQKFLDSRKREGAAVLKDWADRHSGSPAAAAILTVFRNNQRS